MRKILVVEDDVRYGNMIHDLLTGENYEVAVYNSPLDAYEAFKSESFDLLVTDLNFREVEGFQFVQLVESLNKGVPIIVSTANTDDDTEIKCLLEPDVCDYIRKPYNLKIFIARINNATNYKYCEEVIAILESESENLTVNLKEHSVIKDNQEIHLTKKEFELVVLLLKNKNAVINRNDMIKNVWAEDIRFLDTRTIDVHIKNLRVKLGVNAIQTIYGVGYKWIE